MNVRSLRSLALLSLALLPAAPARAFTIQSAVSDPCHETITLDALERVEPPVLSVDSPADAVWRRLAARIRADLGRSSYPADDAILVAAVLGVRDPDVRDSTPTDFDELRHVHLPDENQPDHFLRRTFDDREEGDEAAAEAGRARVQDLLARARAAFDADPLGQNLSAEVIWVENYGEIEVEVWAPLFLLAQAAHALQDSFAHTYRSADTMRVQQIQNYAEAVEGSFDAERDGPRHSSALDHCNDPQNASLSASATQASAELFEAAFTTWGGPDTGATDAVVDRWLSLDDLCRAAGDCDSPWIEHAVTGETSSPFTCRVAASPRRQPVVVIATLLAVLALGARCARPKS